MQRAKVLGGLICSTAFLMGCGLVFPGSAEPIPTLYEIPTLPPTDTPVQAPTLPPSWTPEAVSEVSEEMIQTAIAQTQSASATTEEPTPSIPPTAASPANPPPTALPAVPTPVQTTTLPATLIVDQWELLITSVVGEPGIETSRQNVLVFATATNHGSQSTFLAIYTVELRDSQGRRYSEELNVTFAAQDKYGLGFLPGADMPPESSEEIVIGYNTPATEKTFTIVPGSNVGSWSGNITFNIQ